jgi:hypothetical protein
MPTYVYRDKDEQVVELVMSVSEMESREHDGFLVHEGQILRRDLAAEHGPARSGCAAWPMKSDAAGVHPSQSGEAYEHSVSVGVPTQFDSRTGQAIFTDRSHRKRYLAARGFIDRNAGYGD